MIRGATLVIAPVVLLFTILQFLGVTIGPITFAASALMLAVLAGVAAVISAARMKKRLAGVPRFVRALSPVLYPPTR